MNFYYYYFSFFDISIIIINLQKFNLGLIYMTAKVSQEELTISDVEVIANEPFEDTAFGKGIYTHKKYHLEKYVFIFNYFLKQLIHTRNIT